MQVILDSSFARPGSAPIWGGKKGEFRDWTNSHPDAVSDSVRMPYISLLIWAFLNRYISVKTSLINTKLRNIVNLGVLFLTMWVNSC